MSSLAGSEGVLSDIWACLPVYTAGLDWTTLAGGGDSDIPRRAFPFPVSCLGGWGGTLGEGLLHLSHRDTGGAETCHPVSQAHWSSPARKGAAQETCFCLTVTSEAARRF